MTLPPREVLTRHTLSAAAVALLVLVVVLGYLFCAPIVVKGLSALQPRELDLTAARSYYSILSAASSFLVGMAGVVLGYLYFHGRIRFEELSSGRERQRAQVKLLLQRLDKIDEAMGALLDGGLSSARKRQACQGILREIDQIVVVLEYADKVLGIEDSDIRAIVRFNSFVEHYARNLLRSNGMSSRRSLGYPLESSRTKLETRERYAERLQEARTGCICQVG